MTASVEYHGHILTPAPQFSQSPEGWTLEVRIRPVGRALGRRRCRGRQIYATEAQANARALAFGRKIVDGELKPRKKK